MFLLDSNIIFHVITVRTFLFYSFIFVYSTIKWREKLCPKKVFIDIVFLTIKIEKYLDYKTRNFASFHGILDLVYFAFSFILSYTM